jgi:hypothetical protein
MKKIILFLLIIFVLLLIINTFIPSIRQFSLNKSYHSMSYSNTARLSEDSIPYGLTASESYQRLPANITASNSSISGQYSTRIISIALLAEDTEKVFADISQLALKYNGSIQYSTISGDTASNRSAILALSIPEKEANTVIAAIHDLNVDVESETTTIQNVTSGYLDAQSRLSAAEAIETQYLQILKNSKTVPDVLAVTEKLSAVRANIEALKSQIKLFNQQINYVTINISIRTAPPATENGWSIGSAIGAALLFLVLTLVWLGMAGIWFLFYILPLLLLLAAVYFVIRFFIRKK